MKRVSAYYREQAARFREMAEGSDERTAATLIRVAEEFEAEAKKLEQPGDPPSE